MVGTNRRTMAPPSPGAPALCKDKAGLDGAVTSRPGLVPRDSALLDSRARSDSPAVSRPNHPFTQAPGRSGPDATRFATHRGSEACYTGAYPHSRRPDGPRSRFNGRPGPDPDITDTSTRRVPCTSHRCTRPAAGRTALRGCHTDVLPRRRTGKRSARRHRGPRRPRSSRRRRRRRRWGWADTSGSNCRNRGRACWGKQDRRRCPPRG
jgi:hypothetical protein